ncbi:MAG: RluA family pseudouridine synthase [Balneola sp.]
MLIHKPQNSRKIRVVSPYPITHRFKVQDEFVGRSLLDMMSTRFPFRPEKEWQTRIENGRVGLNEQKSEAITLLSKTDSVFHHNPNVIEPSVPDEVEILEETEDWIAVYKPAPLPMHPGGRYFKNTLTAILEEMGYAELKIVHRLDAVTSGIVLLAKNKTFAQKAMTEFAEGRVQKTYYAEVSGIPEEDSITITAPIKRKTGFVFESNPDLTNAKPAETTFTVVERKENSAIIKCEPKTGRTHQIRLHLEHWGYPIIDDPIYGINGDKTSKKAQKTAISLVSSGLRIEGLGVEVELNTTQNIPSNELYR